MELLLIKLLILIMSMYLLALVYRGVVGNKQYSYLGYLILTSAMFFIILAFGTEYESLIKENDHNNFLYFVYAVFWGVIIQHSCIKAFRHMYDDDKDQTPTEDGVK